MTTNGRFGANTRLQRLLWRLLPWRPLNNLALNAFELAAKALDRAAWAERSVARDLSLLVRQGPGGTLYVRIPVHDHEGRAELGTVWAHVDVLDWVTDESLLGDAVTRPVRPERTVRPTQDARDSLKRFRDAGGG